MDTQKRLKTEITPRGYEMDASASVPLSVISSHMEHSRWSTMRNQSFAMSNYWSRGMIRAQRIELFGKVTFGVDLIIHTWVGRVGRTSFDFVHEVRRKSDHEVLVSASVTAVNISPEGRPTPLKPGAESAVTEGGGPNVIELTAGAPSDAWVREAVALPSQQDVLQHVNHARYIDLVEDTRWLATRDGAFGEEREARAPKKLWIAYDDQARAGDDLNILAWAQSESAFGFEIRKQGTTLTRARIET